MRNILFAIFSSTLTFCSCNITTNYKLNNDHKNTLSNLKEKFSEWRLDTMGCKGHRNKYRGVIDSINRTGITKVFTKSNLKEIMGPPEFEYVSPTDSSLFFQVYFMDYRSIDCRKPKHTEEALRFYDLVPTVDVIYQNGKLHGIFSLDR